MRLILDSAFIIDKGMISWAYTLIKTLAAGIAGLGLLLGLSTCASVKLRNDLIRPSGPVF